ncbi:MAG: NfeD family protein [Gammaproteobacteria bacterium]|nr:NfeD family protein [Gammaproteobacteria bacterium]
MMLENIHPTHWHWWILCVALLILEVLLPGIFFFWLAIAAGVAGLLVLLIPELAFEYQLLIFSVASVMSVAAMRMYFSKHPGESDAPTLNAGPEQHLGKTVLVSDDINSGIGRVRLNGSTWQVEGPDCPAGSRVKIVAVDGIRFKVEAVSPN